MVRISIITPVLNGAGTIRECLESVIRQTHRDVEHIVVDAASTDGTVAILDEYKERLARVFSEPDRGIYDGMNKGLRLATGEVVGILNADDMYNSPSVLEKVARVFADEEVDSCYGDLVYLAKDHGESGCRVRDAQHPGPLNGKRELENSEGLKVVRYWRAGQYARRKFYWGWMVPHPTFFVRRAVYERFGSFNLEMGTAADYELMLRFLVRHRLAAAYLPEILIRMRSGGASNVTLRARLQANRMDRMAWAVNGLKPYPWTLLLKPLRKAGQWLVRP